MKGKELAEYLLKHPEAEIMFCDDQTSAPVYYPGNPNKGSPNMERVDLGDFEFDEKRDVFILPNLCKCYPEPD